MWYTTATYLFTLAAAPQALARPPQARAEPVQASAKAQPPAKPEQTKPPVPASPPHYLMYWVRLQQPGLAGSSIACGMWMGPNVLSMGASLWTPPLSKARSAISPGSARANSWYTLCVDNRQKEALMHTRVQMWGNSLALRIPKSFAAETQLQPDALVDISLVEGRLISSPVRAAGVQLEQLLAGVTEDNRHHEWQTGDAVGRQVW